MTSQLDPAAIHRFAHQQKQLLVDTYNDAWAVGVVGYEPDPDPPQQPHTAQHLAEAGLAGAALLAVRQLYPYKPPTTPDPLSRAQALAPAFGGVNRMMAELNSYALTSMAQVAEDYAGALQTWLEGNSWRLDAGDSVAWAGEQNGYGEAADQDGQLLEWQAEGDDRVCEDCQTLADMPPQALADWPSRPGDGTTECNVGCRCNLVASEVSVVPGDTYAPALTDDQRQLVGALSDRQSESLGAMMPDAQYLD